MDGKITVAFSEIPEEPTESLDVLLGTLSYSGYHVLKGSAIREFNRIVEIIKNGDTTYH